MFSGEQLRVLGVGKEDECKENGLYKAFREGRSRLLKVERKKEGQEVGEMEDSTLDEGASGGEAASFYENSMALQAS